jgi:hypothetical protein
MFRLVLPNEMVVALSKWISMGKIRYLLFDFDWPSQQPGLTKATERLREASSASGQVVPGLHGLREFPPGHALFTQ